MPRLTLFFVLVGLAAAQTIACDSSGDDAGSVTCGNLNFTGFPHGDITGAWHAREICVSTIDPTRFGLCAQATVAYDFTPNGYSQELRSDGTFSRSGTLTLQTQISVPRTCSDNCDELDGDARSSGGSCVESVNSCDCSVPQTATPSSGGTWKLEDGELYFRSASATDWGNGQEFQTDGSHFITKAVTEEGVAIFTIFTR